MASLPENNNDILHLRVVQDSETVFVDEAQLEFVKETTSTQTLSEVEEFWAGRNLAMRNSARKAA